MSFVDCRATGIDNLERKIQRKHSHSSLEGRGGYLDHSATVKTPPSCCGKASPGF
jgi:hypothetical protein